MPHTWEDQVQEYWKSGALPEGDSEMTREWNRNIQKEPGRVLPKALWLKSREMPIAERRELDALWARLLDIEKAGAERAAVTSHESGGLHLSHALPAAPESSPSAPCELKLYDLTTDVRYCDGCRDVTWYFGRGARQQPVARYEVLIGRPKRKRQDPDDWDGDDNLVFAVNSLFTEDEARLLEMLMPLNTGLLVTKRRVPLPYDEYHHRFYQPYYDSTHVLQALRFEYALPFAISIYYDRRFAEDSIADEQV